jgi:hypothetical protein
MPIAQELCLREVAYGAGAPRCAQWGPWLKKFLKGTSCAACGQTDDLTGHHEIPFHIDPSKEMDERNVVPLCQDRCHLIFGHFNDFQLYNPNVRKDCADYLARRMAAKAEKAKGHN